MMDFLEQIVNFFVTAADFVVNFLDNLFTMISQIPKYIDVLLSFFGFLPDWIFPALLIVLFAGVILYILGR